MSRAVRFKHELCFPAHFCNYHCWKTKNGRRRSNYDNRIIVIIPVKWNWRKRTFKVCNIFQAVGFDSFLFTPPQAKLWILKTLQISIPRARNFVEMLHRNLWKFKRKRELLPYHGLSNKIVQFVVESVARLWLQRLQITNLVRVFLCPCVGPVSWHVIVALYLMINLEWTI